MVCIIFAGPSVEKQQEPGDAGLLPDDKCLAEINLEDLESSFGEWQEYWLLAIQTAQRAMGLRRRQQISV